MSNKDTGKREHSAAFKPLVKMEEKDKKSGGKSFQFFVAIIADLMAVTDGMAVAWTGPLLPYFLSDKSHIPMTENEAEWIESCLPLGAILGLPLVGWFVHKFGRKKSVLMGTTVLAVSWIIIAVADRVEYIYLARCLSGMALNMAYVAVPMYVGEIAHKSIRGLLSSLVLIMSHFGIVLIYIVGPYLSYYVPSVVSLVILTIEVIVFSFMPESPYYLLLINKPDEARKSLMKFRGGNDDHVDVELDEMMESIKLEKQSTATIGDLFRVKNYRNAILIMLVMNFTIHFSGQDVMLMNLQLILENAGTLYMDSRKAPIVFAVIFLVASIVASLMVDKFGRKFLLVISTISTGLCLVAIAIYFNLKYSGLDTLPYSWVPIASVMVYAAAFKIGIGTVQIVLTSELFASNIKAIGMTVADGAYVGCSFLSLQVFFALKNWVDVHLPFYLFASCSFLACVYIVLCLPETKGRSLDEIQKILRGKKGEAERRVVSLDDASAVKVT